VLPSTSVAAPALRPREPPSNTPSSAEYQELNDAKDILLGQPEAVVQGAPKATADSEHRRQQQRMNERQLEQ